MNKLSKILSTGFLGAALTLSGPVISIASAQGPGGRGQDSAQQGPEAGRRGPHMRGRRGHRGHPFAQLNLTDAQRQQMQAIRRQAAERGRALRQSGDRQAMMALRRRTFEQIRNVLTPAQRAQAEQLRATHMQERFEHRMTRLTERLSLTPTQAQQVRGILSHANTQRRAIFEQSRLDETSPREALQALHAQTQAQLSSVLSAEQMSTLGELREHRGRRGHGPRGHRGPRGGEQGQGGRGPRGPR